MTAVALAAPPPAALAPALDRLRHEGALEPSGWGEAADLARRLIRLGERDLPLARLFEGHVNALKLIRIHGTAPQSQVAARAAAAGTLFGVWGADADRPLRRDGDRLSGGKRYASGLGLVGQALVTAGSGAAQELIVIDASDPRRHRPETWDMTGMQDTISGDIDCDGLPAPPAARIGAPGVYTTEPWFVGGTWRIAALQLGGTLGLLGAARDALAAAGRIEAEAQRTRLGPVVIRALAAGAYVTRAALLAEGDGGRARPERAAALSAAARLLTEDLGLDAIAAVERSIGLALFRRDHPAGRIARDLAVYLRQAAPDAFLQRVAAHALGAPAPLSDLLDG